MFPNYESTDLPFYHYTGDHYNQGCFHLSGLVVSQVVLTGPVALNQSGMLYSVDMPSEP